MVYIDLLKYRDFMVSSLLVEAFVVLAIVVKFVGTNWITKLMPAVVIGPTVAIIGLSLAGNAVGDLLSGSYYVTNTVTVSGVVQSLDGLTLVGTPISLGADGFYATYESAETVLATNTWIALLCGLVTLFTTIVVSIYGKKTLKMIPFVIGILAGYAVAAIFTGIGYAAGNDALKVIDFTKFANMEWYPNFTFIQGFGSFKDFPDVGSFFGYFGTLVIAYVPVAFVVFAEHIADHRNLSSIIGRDLLKEPGLHRTLLGDGLGSMAGAFFGGCPNTTYGESVGTVAISGNASVRTILVTSIMAMVLAFVGPFSTFLATIPACVIGLMCASAASYRRGKDLDKDPAFQARIADPEQRQYIYGGSATTLDKVITKEAKASVFVFLGALLVIVLFAFCQMIKLDGKPLATVLGIPKMNIIIQIIMLTAAACNIMFCKAAPKKAVAGAVWQSGMVAVVAIYGIAWLADTYFSNYMDEMKAMLTGLVTSYPWSIAFVFFLVSVLINSQGAVVVAMLPLAYELGIAGPVLLGVLPSVYGYFFIPNYPSDIATVNFDRSGTTKIGKYLLNHSFMMPGLISTVVATVVGYLITNVFFSGYFSSFIN